MLARYVVQQLHELELNPTLLSNKAVYPYTRSCQTFFIDKEIDKTLFLVHVLFQYGSDESTLFISNIDWQADIDSWGP